MGDYFEGPIAALEAALKGIARSKGKATSVMHTAVS